jgi:hypothetical protein
MSPEPTLLQTTSLEIGKQMSRRDQMTEFLLEGRRTEDIKLCPEYHSLFDTPEYGVAIHIMALGYHRSRADKHG